MCAISYSNPPPLPKILDLPQGWEDIFLKHFLKHFSSHLKVYWSGRIITIWGCVLIISLGMMGARLKGNEMGGIQMVSEAAHWSCKTERVLPESRLILASLLTAAVLQFAWLWQPCCVFSLLIGKTLVVFSYPFLHRFSASWAIFSDSSILGECSVCGFPLNRLAQVRLCIMVLKSRHAIDVEIASIPSRPWQRRVFTQ